MEIHLFKEPDTIIFRVCDASIPNIFFIVSAIFSCINFQHENARSIVIINKTDIDTETLRKLTDLYYTEANVITDFEYLTQKLSNI